MAFNILLIIHIIGGGVSLLVGLVIMLIKKADKRHVLLGNIYFYALLIASFVALPMSYLHSNYFLFIIAVFTGFMLLSGKRYLKLKKSDDVKQIDWLLTLVMLVFSFAFLFFGIYNLVHSNTFGIVLILFGGIGFLFVSQDRKNFKGKSLTKNYWLTTHLQRMVGSYIASVTAFLVVNNTILPGVVAWLLPTVILVPLIVRWSRRYVVKN